MPFILMLSQAFGERPSLLQRRTQRPSRFIVAFRRSIGNTLVDTCRAFGLNKRA